MRYLATERQFQADPGYLLHFGKSAILMEEAMLMESKLMENNANGKTIVEKQPFL